MLIAQIVLKNQRYLATHEPNIKPCLLMLPSQLMILHSLGLMLAVEVLPRAARPKITIFCRLIPGLRVVQDRWAAFEISFCSLPSYKRSTVWMAHHFITAIRSDQQIAFLGHEGKPATRTRRNAQHSELFAPATNTPQDQTQDQEPKYPKTCHHQQP